MATNKSMLALMERMIYLMEQQKEIAVELAAGAKVLKWHVSEQKKDKHGISQWNDRYVYDREKERYYRV